MVLLLNATAGVQALYGAVGEVFLYGFSSLEPMKPTRM
jgi:hypothetical protein